VNCFCEREQKVKKEKMPKMGKEWKSLQNSFMGREKEQIELINK
jgi:hypothetical protein